MLNSHSTQAYVVSIVQCRIIHRRGVRITFEWSLVIANNMGVNMKLQDYVYQGLGLCP